MWKRCNPNPLGKAANDCVVRAIAVAMGRSWQDVYADLCEQGRIECDMPSSNSVWGAYLRKMGFEQFLLPDDCPKCLTIRAFSERFPRGTYIIGTGDHAVAVLDDKNYYDSWDSGDEVASYFWRVR